MICTLLSIFIWLGIKLFTMEMPQDTNTSNPIREPLTFKTKDINIYVKDVWRKDYSNVFKKDVYYIETDGNNCHDRLYINKETYEYLKNNLKEPGLVNFSCKVMNGYMNYPPLNARGVRSGGF